VFVYKDEDICLSDFDDNFREDSPVLSKAEIAMVKPSETIRKSDAMAVQRAFSMSGKVKKKKSNKKNQILILLWFAFFYCNYYYCTTLFNGFCPEFYTLKFQSTIIHYRGDGSVPLCGSNSSIACVSATPNNSKGIAVESCCHVENTGESL
jgi:hypothetical protein